MADDPDLTLRVEGSTESLGFALDDKGHVHVDSVLEEFQAKQVKYQTESGVWMVLGASKDGWSLASFTAPTSCEVPSTTILCTGTTHIFYQYHPAAGEAQPRRLVKSKEYTLDLIGPTTPETIKPQLKGLVCAIVASLRFEKENVEAALASKKLKLMD